MGAVEGRHVGLASGINNAISRAAALLAIAVMSVIMLAAFNGALDQRLAGLQLPPDARQALDEQRIKLAGAEPPPGLGEPARSQMERAIDESFMDAFRLVMLCGAALALAGALSAALLIEGKQPAAE